MQTSNYVVEQWRGQHRASACVHTCRAAACTAARSALLQVVLLRSAGARQTLTRIRAQRQQQGVRGIRCLSVRAACFLAVVFGI